MTWIKPCFQSLRLSRGTLAERNYRLAGWLQAVIRDGEDGGVKMGFVLVKYLNDVPVRLRIQYLEDIGTCRQGLGSHTRNFDRPGERYNCFSVEIIGHCSGHDQYKEQSQTQYDS